MGRPHWVDWDMAQFGQLRTVSVAAHFSRQRPLRIDTNSSLVALLRMRTLIVRP